ncbi:MAG: AAA family ATPase [Solibacillus sp.]
MVTEQLQQETMIDLNDVIEQIDSMKTFFQLNEMDKTELTLYRGSVFKLVQYFETNEFAKLTEELSTEQAVIDAFVKKLNLFRVVCAEKTFDKAQTNYGQLIDMGIVEFLVDILKQLKGKVQNPYSQWLQNNAKLIDELVEGGYLYETITKLVRKIPQLTGSKMYVKLVTKRNNPIEFTPVLFVNGRFMELKHPVTKRRWLVSGNAVNHKEALKRLHVGDIIQVKYSSVYKNATQFYPSLITLEYDNFTVLAQDFDNALAKKFTPNELQAIRQNLHAFSSDSRILIKELMKIVVPTSRVIEEEIEKVRAKNEMLSAELATVNEQQQNFIAKKESVQQQLTVEQKKWASILERLEYTVENENDQDCIPYNRETFFADLQSRIYEQSDKELLYDKTILQLVLNAMRANILTILTGPSGTGKSSLIEAIGQAITNVKVTMIPVQSSWTDAQDLLGYFHPNEKVFVATPFMEALAAARIAELADQDELHIICLDEMNLAHIEYYFAQFLSIREQKQQKIAIYPPRYEQWAFAVDAGEIEADFYTKQSAKELIEKYPASFMLPKNVRFVGTLNMDHTVKALSPKVVDRSLIIELVKLKDEQEQAMIDEIVQHSNTQAIEVPFTQFMEETAELDEQVLDKIMAISALFDDFRDIPLNSRGKKHLRAILSYWEQPSDEVIDLLIKGKILPRIEVKKSTLENIRVAQKLKGYKLSQQKLAAMLNTNHTVSFW